MATRLCVLGLGYIGLPTAIMFAQTGTVQVVGVDTNLSVLESLRKAETHIEEPGLQDALLSVVRSGSFSVADRPVEADAFMIAVPTPFKEAKKADLSSVEAATRSLVPVLKKGNLIVLESTVPPQTVEKIMVPILAQTGLDPYEDLYVVHSPERVIPGRVLYELQYNSRIVGGLNEQSALKAKELYSTFVKGEILITDASTAEMTKLMENTFRDVNIALANELALVCSELGIDAWEVARLANYHPRVSFLNPGPGVGGHCIAVDPWFVVEQSPVLSRLIRTARIINDEMPERVSDLVDMLAESPGRGKIAVLGVAYKPDVDDMRESPALHIVDILSKRGYLVVAYDPHVKAPYASKVDTLDTALSDADLIVLATDHKEFASLDPNTVIELARRPLILDTRNTLNVNAFLEKGVTVFTLGNGKHFQQHLARLKEVAAASAHGHS